MPLSSIIDIARSSLATTSELSQVTSRNIAGSNDPSTSRKIANVITTGGGVRIANLIRSTTTALQDGMIGATSVAARLDVLVAGIDRLDLTGGDSTASSPASRLASLQGALQTYSVNPTDVTAAGSVVANASDLVSLLHDWGNNVAKIRQEADEDIHSSVGQLSEMLGRVGDLNARIITGTIAKADVTDQLDERDSLLKNIAQIVGITVVNRANNDVALYTDSGLTLFDVSPRSVAVQAGSLVDGAAGPAVMIDGVPATGATSVMPISSGRLAGLVALRDQTSLTLAAQLDAIAGGLVSVFAESDQGNPGTLPPLAGLFQMSAGSTQVPADGTWIPGLARSIAVNANVDPAQGGDAMRLRDGGISAPGNSAYIYNTTGASGFSGRVQQLVDALAQEKDRPPQARLQTADSALDFAASSIGWLQSQRQINAQNSDYATVQLQRSQDALAKVAGINIDDEMTELMELERTYQASAKLITTVNDMFGALMEAVR